MKFVASIDATAVVRGERIDQNGEKYFNVKDIDVDFHIGHARIELGDLFNGDKELGKFIYLFFSKTIILVIESYIFCA